MACMENKATVWAFVLPVYHGLKGCKLMNVYETLSKGRFKSWTKVKIYQYIYMYCPFNPKIVQNLPGFDGGNLWEGLLQY